jgi:hypothetical protein
VTKLFIATIITGSLLMPTTGLAAANLKASNEPARTISKANLKKEAKKIGANARAVASASKKQSKKAAKPAVKAIKKVVKKANRKVVRIDFDSPQTAPKVVHLDFDTQPIKAEKTQMVAKQEAAAAKTQVVKTTMPPTRAPASLAKPITVAQLKKTTKPYWAAYCRDGIVLNSHVYCALKNPQRQGLRAKQVKIASNKDIMSKKRK